MSRQLHFVGTMSNGMDTRKGQAGLKDAISLHTHGDSAPNQPFNYRCICTTGEQWDIQHMGDPGESPVA
jgi:hypothetical protein